MTTTNAKAAAKNDREREDRRQRRDATGQVIEKKTKRGTGFGLRMRLPDGTRVYETLAVAAEGIGRREAEARAGRLLARVRLGQYETKAQRTARAQAAQNARVAVPGFQVFAGEWLAQRVALGGRSGTGLSEAGAADLRWRLGHLIAWFSDVPLDGISPAEVERFALAKRQAKVGEGGLSPVSVNKCLATLEAVLRRAIRLGLLDRNPVDGWRVPTGAGKRRSYVRTAEHVEALLDAAGVVDRERAAFGPAWRRAAMAVLVLAGPRISEALMLRRGDVDLAAGKLHIAGTKTENAQRDVPMLALLRDELASYVASRPELGPGDLLFGTSAGLPLGRSNFGSRCLHPVIAKANELLAERKQPLLPDGLTAHAMRRTAASIWFVVPWSLPQIKRAMGHATASMTLEAYADEVDHDAEVRLRALVTGEPLEVPTSADFTKAARSSIL